VPELLGDSYGGGASDQTHESGLLHLLVCRDAIPPDLMVLDGHAVHSGRVALHPCPREAVEGDPPIKGWPVVILALPYAGSMSPLGPARADDGPVGHAFISYVHEDAPTVTKIQRRLERAGIKVWRDREDLWPGESWRRRIRQAITDNALAFIACFSNNSAARSASYQNEELILAVEQLRLRPPDQAWLIPVRLSDCMVPDLDIGAGRTLRDLQRVDLFDNHWDAGSRRLVDGVHRILIRTPGRLPSLSSVMANELDSVIGSNVSRLLRERAWDKLLSDDGPTRRPPERA